MKKKDREVILEYCRILIKHAEDIRGKGDKKSEGEASKHLNKMLPTARDLLFILEANTRQLCPRCFGRKVVEQMKNPFEIAGSFTQFIEVPCPKCSGGTFIGFKGGVHAEAED